MKPGDHEWCFTETKLSSSTKCNCDDLYNKKEIGIGDRYVSRSGCDTRLPRGSSDSVLDRRSSYGDRPRVRKVSPETHGHVHGNRQLEVPSTLSNHPYVATRGSYKRPSFTLGVSYDGCTKGVPSRTRTCRLRFYTTCRKVYWKSF